MSIKKKFLTLAMFFMLFSSKTIALNYNEVLKTQQEGISVVDLIRKGIQHTPSINWVEADTLIKEIKNHPQRAVGFDVDDTLLFTFPGFNYLKKKFALNDKEIMTNESFWTELNNKWEKLDIPKQTAGKLLKAHYEHKDKIYFITARIAIKNENLTKIIKKAYGLADIRPVIFLNNSNKTEEIKKHGIKVYYGDSNTDIASAIAAGAEGIRIMRSSLTSNTNTPNTKNGCFGERVVIDSQY